MRLRELATDDEQHYELHALAGGNAVIDSRTAAAHHDAEVTFPINESVRQGEVTRHERLSRRFPLFNRLQDFVGSDPIVFPIGRLDQRSNRRRARLRRQLHDPHHTDQFTQVQWGISRAGLTSLPTFNWKEF